jgi:hypothetical protein
MKISDAQVQKPLADLIDRQKPFREICLSYDLAFVHVLKCHMRHAAFLFRNSGTCSQYSAPNPLPHPGLPPW